VIINGQDISKWIREFQSYYKSLNQLVLNIVDGQCDYAFIHSRNLTQYLIDKKQEGKLSGLFWTEEAFSYTSAENVTGYEIWQLFMKIWEGRDIDLIIDWIKGKSPDFQKKIKKEIQKSKKLRQLSFLIHRIMHLFLPLDIDLLGIEEVEESKKVEYLKEVINGKSENYYKRKLLDLTTFVAKIDKVNSITANVDKKSIGKSIKEIIEESNKQDMEENLFTLCAINESGNAIDQKSPIYEFMNLLDAKIGKKNSGNGLNTTDVNEILEFFKTAKKDKKFEKINSFHDWYCEVFRCLDSLRKKLDEEG